MANLFITLLQGRRIRGGSKLIPLLISLLTKEATKEDGPLGRPYHGLSLEEGAWHPSALTSSLSLDMA